MKKQMRKAMLTTIGMLVVGVMCLTGVTYAWFTTGEQATVQNFDVNVQSAVGAIQIATTPAKGTTLSFSGLASPNLTAYSNKYLNPVSAVKPASGNALSFYTAELSSDGTKLTSAALPEGATEGKGVVETNSYYLTFDLYFYNPSDQTLSVYLDTASTIAKITSATETEGSFLATRVAFTKYTSVDFDASTNPGSDTASHTAMGETIIYEPNATTHTAEGVNAGATQGQVSTYVGIKGASNTTEFDRVTAGTYSEAVDTYVDGEKTAIVADLTGGHVVKVTVTVWLEGQDVDCLNSIAGKAFNANLVFTSKATDAK